MASNMSVKLCAKVRSIVNNRDKSEADIKNDLIKLFNTFEINVDDATLDNFILKYSTRNLKNVSSKNGNKNKNKNKNV